MTTFACCRFSGKRVPGAGMHPTHIVAYDLALSSVNASADLES